MTFEDKYNALIQEYEAKLSIPNWFVSGFKTLLDKNITIEDWNKMYMYLQRMASDNNVLRKFLDLFKFEFDERFIIEDSLTSTATNRPLSANQGRVLNEKINSSGAWNIGTFLINPSQKDHNVLNMSKYIKTPGFYTFAYSNIQHVMFIDYINETYTKQTIYANNDDGFTRIVRIFNGSEWSVVNDEIPTTAKVQTMIDKKLSTKTEIPTDMRVGDYVFLIKEEK